MSTETTTTTALVLQSDFQNQFLAQVDTYLSDRKINSPEFKLVFEKVAADMIFSQTVDGLESIKKARPLSLFNAIFVATEIGASFSKKEISVLPFSASVTTKFGDVVTKKATGENDLTIVVDINFQKQMILKMPNCKKFFSCEVKEGVQVYTDMSTGNCIFEGRGEFSKPTIGYYACFFSTDGEKYDLFMTCAEIIDRAKFNPGYKAKNYENTSKSIHYEKIVVRNLLKGIPREESKLDSILAYDEIQELTPYEDVTNDGKALEEAKKELSGKKEPVKSSEKKTVKFEKETEVTPTDTEDSKQSEITKFF